MQPKAFAVKAGRRLGHVEHVRKPRAQGQHLQLLEADQNRGALHGGYLLAESVIGRVGQAKHFGGERLVAFDNMRKLPDTHILVAQGIHEAPHHVRHAGQPVDAEYSFPHPVQEVFLRQAVLRIL